MAVTIGRHTLIYDPVGLWQFNETLNDTSGNAFNMTVSSGTERYTDIYPGVRGIGLNTTRLIYNTFTSTLAITGDITLECLLYLRAYPITGFEAGIVTHAAAGETSGDNVLYAMQLDGASGALSWLSESGSGTNAPFTRDMGPGLGLSHIAATRISNVVQLYVNGRAQGAASSALTAPTGGGNGRLVVGYPDVGFFAPEGVMSSLKICNVGLSAAQIASEYNATLGPLYGYV